MNLFNIGVEGQYRMAALVAAAFGAWVSLPAPLHVLAILVVAMLVGAAWASIPAVLKVTRGVHEVISSIMLNSIATGIGAYMLGNWFIDKSTTGSLLPRTKPLPESAQMPPLNGALEKIGIDLPSGASVYGFVLIAIALGFVFKLAVDRTRFGFDLRATGVNPGAAEASGVSLKNMTVRVLLISGAIAGLAGMGDVLGYYHGYSTDFPTGFGFTGIAVALLGRNRPVGIAFGALLFAYLDRSAQILDLDSIPREIVIIMQAIILLSVVIAYEIVQHIGQTQETKAAAEATRRMEDHTEPSEVGAS
jgi:simple sugar transport system permease protein